MGSWYPLLFSQVRFSFLLWLPEGQEQATQPIHHSNKEPIVREPLGESAFIKHGLKKKQGRNFQAFLSLPSATQGNIACEYAHGEGV